jgi:hypothetical protein
MGHADDQCGTAGAFLIEVGISSSFHMAKFWSLTGTPRTAATEAATPIAAPPDSKSVKAAPNNVGDVITRALKAAGLIKAQ